MLTITNEIQAGGKDTVSPRGPYYGDPPSVGGDQYARSYFYIVLSKIGIYF